MKNALILCLGLLLFLLSSCGSPSPSGVAADFAVALNDLDFEKARSLSTPKTHKIISVIETAAAMGQEETLAPKGRPDCTCEEKETMATCQCCYPAAETNEEDDCLPIIVVQKEGTWLVDVSKESLMNAVN